MVTSNGRPAPRESPDLPARPIARPEPAATRVVALTDLDYAASILGRSPHSTHSAGKVRTRPAIPGWPHPA